MNNSQKSCARPGKARVCVIGAGVVGLATAVRILEESQRRNGVALEVTLVADKFSPHTTSDGSGGLWSPYNFGNTPPSLIRKWSSSTWGHLYQLAMTAGVAGTVGAQFVSGYHLFDTQIEEVLFKDQVLGFRYLTPQELAMFPSAKFKNAGGKTEFKTVEKLSQVADQYDVVVNCTGLRGGQLTADPHTLPIRGQLTRIRAPWIKHFYLFERKDKEPSYILPLGDDVLVGGMAQRNNWKEEVDRTDSQDLWSRAVAIYPFLQGAQTIGEWAGLRPGRSTVRLEKDQVRTKDGRTVPVVHNYGHGGCGVTLHWGVVHNYGHGGCGVTLHWGCAEEAAHLVLSSLPLPPPPLHSKM
ncbi:hypothetical protein ACOMHN_003141 [Nucella lapillus]